MDSDNYDNDYSIQMIETIIDWIILVEDSQKAFEQIQVQFRFIMSSEITN